MYNNSTGRTYYAFKNSVSAQGQVGTIIQASTAPEMSSVPIGYEKETAYGKNSTSSIVVAADGSSTLKVYYSLIRYTFKFNLNNQNGRITMGGRTYSGSEYSITDVVLGKDISRQWPSSTSNPKEIYDYTNYSYFDKWDGDLKTKRYEVTEDLIAKADRITRTRTLIANWTRSNTPASVEYWLQQPDGSYQKSDYYSQSFIRTGSLGAKQIFGYDYLGDGVTPSGGYQRSQTEGILTPTVSTTIVKVITSDIFIRVKY